MWWNAGLRPGKGDPASDRKREAALAVIGDLIALYRPDIIGLCEVSDDDIRELGREFGPLGFGTVPIQDKVGKTQFDMCLLYRLGTVSPDSANMAVKADIKSGQTRKIGCAIEVTVRSSGDKLSLIVSHWPSRLQRGRDHVDRIFQSGALRDFVDQKREDGWSHFILMGDYNDEPCDRGMFNALRAVRDHALVSKQRDHLYNPFWRHLAGDPYSAGAAKEIRHGTLHYAAGHEPQQDWWLFDQMMFSADFVSDGPWHLVEERTGVIPIERNIRHYASTAAANSGKKPDKPFDHLPIYSTLERI